MRVERDRLDRFVGVSVFFHAGLFSLVLLSPKLFPSDETKWGTKDGGAGGINVKVVGSIGGIALPAPPVVNEKAAANDSPGFYKNEETAPPAPVPDKPAELIPETKAPVKTKAEPKPKPSSPAPKAAAPPEPDTPANAVPFGAGGRPALSYGQFSTGAGQAGIGFGDEAFGDMYGTYVNSITRIISNNWLKSMVDSRVQKAPRVYVTFDIQRDGTISDVGIDQGSGIPSLDRSALRAVSASTLPPLPAGYRGSKVKVRFYFEYSR
jgi:protein TonB